MDTPTTDTTDGDVSNKRSLENAARDPKETKKLIYEQYPCHGEHKRAVSYVQVAPHRVCKNRDDAILVASASADGVCKIWDLQTSIKKTREGLLQPHGTCIGHARGINAVAWNPLVPLLATASDDKTARLWDAVTSEPLVELKGHDNFVFCVDQTHSTVATGSFDETVKLWDIRTGDCVSTLPAHSDPVTAVSLSRDGTVVCSASHDGLIRIWDVATGECLKTIFAAGNPSVSSAKLAPNRKFVLAGTLDSALRLWPVTLAGKQRCAKTYTSKEHFVNSKYSIVADFLYNGDIVVGSENGKAVIFDLQTKEVVQILEGHKDAVLAVAAHDRKPFIATGGMANDRKVEFWKGVTPEASESPKKQKI